MSGTDRTKPLITGGPVVILVEPQLGENIGMVARAMANFGMSELRLVKPRDGWPSEKARVVAAKADHVIDGVEVFESLGDAVGDLSYLLATTARQRDMLKPVLAPEEAMNSVKTRMNSGEKAGILFGRERWGLENDEIALANEIVTFPVNPAFASLNIAQAVLLIAHEWMKVTLDDPGEPVFREPETLPASREDLIHLFDHLESALDDAKYFYPPEMREHMMLNIKNIFTHANLRKQEIQTVRGVIAALERRWMRPRKSQKKESS